MDEPITISRNLTYTDRWAQQADRLRHHYLNRCGGWWLRQYRPTESTPSEWRRISRYGR